MVSWQNFEDLVNTFCLPVEVRDVVHSFGDIHYLESIQDRREGWGSGGIW